MPESRILAVEHVKLEGRAGGEEALRWFYQEVVGLGLVEEPPQPSPRLRFRSAELELRYAILPEPLIEVIDHRVTLVVNSLERTRTLLDQAGAEYAVVTGLCYTDRWLSLLDPGGNRVAIRQAWRPVF